MSSIRPFVRPVLVSSALLSAAAGVAFTVTFLLRWAAFGG